MQGTHFALYHRREAEGAGFRRELLSFLIEQGDLTMVKQKKITVVRDSRQAETRRFFWAIQVNRRKKINNMLNRYFYKKISVENHIESAADRAYDKKTGQSDLRK